MNRKGQLGQIITSFPVLLLVLVIMVLFFIVAGLINAFGGSEESVSVHGIEETNSKILLEMFLGDYVLIDGKKEKIEEVLLDLMKSDQEKKEELSKLIQQRFHEKYGCDKNNFLQFYDVGPGISSTRLPKDEYTIYINYPLTFPNWKKTKFTTLSTIIPSIILNNGAMNKKLSNGDNWYIATKGNVKC